jgi:hypothetical protein
VTGFLGENTTKPICPRRKRRLRRRIGLRVARPRRRRVIEGWRKEAIKANREIGRVVLAYEAGRDGSLGAPRDSFDISWLRAPLIKAPRSPSDLLDQRCGRGVRPRRFVPDSLLEGGVTSELVSGIRGSGPHFGILFPPLTRPRARAREGSDENPAAVGRSAAAANSC